MRKRESLAAHYLLAAADYLAKPLISFMRKLPQGYFARTAASCRQVVVDKGCAKCANMVRKHTPYGGERALRKRLPTPGLGTPGPRHNGQAAGAPAITHGRLFWIGHETRRHAQARRRMAWQRRTDRRRARRDPGIQQAPASGSEVWGQSQEPWRPVWADRHGKWPLLRPRGACSIWGRVPSAGLAGWQSTWRHSQAEPQIERP